jgi:hypothetical protein
MNVAFPLNVAMQSEIEQSDVSSNIFVRGDFDYELQALWMHMMGEVTVVLAPFFTFASTYIATKAHNMLTLMQDLCFKSLDVVKGFVRRANVIQMVSDMATSL